MTKPSDITKLLAIALMAPDALGDPIPARHIELEGPHSSHTKDEDGNFKHPFLSRPDHIESIYYKDSKTISTKLERRPGPSRHIDHV